MGSKKPTEWLLEQTYLVHGKTRRKCERNADKILDTLFAEHGEHVGVVTGHFVDPENEELLNAAERALERLGKSTRDHFPLGANQSFTHGYNVALRYARNVIREELTRNHGS